MRRTIAILLIFLMFATLALGDDNYQNQHLTHSKYPKPIGISFYQTVDGRFTLDAPASNMNVQTASFRYNTGGDQQALTHRWLWFGQTCNYIGRLRVTYKKNAKKKNEVIKNGLSRNFLVYNCVHGKKIKIAPYPNNELTLGVSWPQYNIKRLDTQYNYKYLSGIDNSGEATASFISSDTINDEDGAIADNNFLSMLEFTTTTKNGSLCVNVATSSRVILLITKDVPTSHALEALNDSGYTYLPNSSGCQNAFLILSLYGISPREYVITEGSTENMLRIFSVKTKNLYRYDVKKGEEYSLSLNDKEWLSRLRGREIKLNLVGLGPVYSVELQPMENIFSLIPFISSFPEGTYTLTDKDGNPIEASKNQDLCSDNPLKEDRWLSDCTEKNTDGNCLVKVQITAIIPPYHSPQSPQNAYEIKATYDNPLTDIKRQTINFFQFCPEPEMPAEEEASTLPYKRVTKDFESKINARCEGTTGRMCNFTYYLKKNDGKSFPEICLIGFYGADGQILADPTKKGEYLRWIVDCDKVDGRTKTITFPNSVNHVTFYLFPVNGKGNQRFKNMLLQKEDVMNKSKKIEQVMQTWPGYQSKALFWDESRGTEFLSGHGGFKRLLSFSPQERSPSQGQGTTVTFSPGNLTALAKNAPSAFVGDDFVLLNQSPLINSPRDNLKLDELGIINNYPVLEKKRWRVVDGEGATSSVDEVLREINQSTVFCLRKKNAHAHVCSAYIFYSSIPDSLSFDVSNKSISFTPTGAARVMLHYVPDHVDEKFGLWGTIVPSAKITLTYEANGTLPVAIRVEGEMKKFITDFVSNKAMKLSDSLEPDRYYINDTPSDFIFFSQPLSEDKIKAGQCVYVKDNVLYSDARLKNDIYNSKFLMGLWGHSRFVIKSDSGRVCDISSCSQKSDVYDKLLLQKYTVLLPSDESEGDETPTSAIQLPKPEISDTHKKFEKRFYTTTTNIHDQTFFKAVYDGAWKLRVATGQTLMSLGSFHPFTAEYSVEREYGSDNKVLNLVFDANGGMSRSQLPAFHEFAGSETKGFTLVDVNDASWSTNTDLSYRKRNGKTYSSSWISGDVIGSNTLTGEVFASGKSYTKPMNMYTREFYEFQKESPITIASKEDCEIMAVWKAVSEHLDEFEQIADRDARVRKCNVLNQYGVGMTAEQRDCLEAIDLNMSIDFRRRWEKILESDAQQYFDACDKFAEAKLFQSSGFFGLTTKPLKGVLIKSKKPDADQQLAARIRLFRTLMADLDITYLKDLDKYFFLQFENPVSRSEAKQIAEEVKKGTARCCAIGVTPASSCVLTDNKIAALGLGDPVAACNNLGTYGSQSGAKMREKSCRWCVNGCAEPDGGGGCATT